MKVRREKLLEMSLKGGREGLDAVSKYKKDKAVVER